MDNEILGIDEEIEKEEAKKENNITSIEEVKKKRKQFHIWTVAGVDHKMKLNTSMITKLESKYRINVSNLILTDNMPTLSVMLTVAQAAIAPWEHGTSMEKVFDLYDKWLEEGGSQQQFLTHVITPTLAVSGFFIPKVAESLLKELEEDRMLM